MHCTCPLVTQSRHASAGLLYSIADHPALAGPITDAMGIHPAACAVELLWRLSNLMRAAAHAVGVAIAVNAALVSHCDNHTLLPMIVSDRHGLGGNGRCGDKG